MKRWRDLTPFSILYLIWRDGHGLPYILKLLREWYSGGPRDVDFGMTPAPLVIALDWKLGRGDAGAAALKSKQI